MPAKAGIQATVGPWIPAFAGMTEALCQFVVQIVLAHVFLRRREAHEGFGNRRPEVRNLRVFFENRCAGTIPAGFGTNILSYRQKPVSRLGRLMATKMDAGLRRHDDNE
jgi:hypothetical protein